MDELGADWLRLWTALGATGDGEAEHARLVAAYREPHRRYHGLDHIAMCLREFAMVRVLATHPAAVEAAVWYHDVVYDPRRGDNEERSAAWAHATLSAAGVAAATVERVAALVLATRHADAGGDADAAVLLDVDLAILGRPAEEFDAYERAIREEYAFVSEPVFRAERARILARFLARPSIYATASFRDGCEARARANLVRSIAALRG